MLTDGVAAIGHQKATIVRDLKLVSCNSIWKEMVLENVHQIVCLSDSCHLIVKMRVKRLEWSEKVRCRNGLACVYRTPICGDNCMILSLRQY